MCGERKWGAKGGLNVGHVCIDIKPIGRNWLHRDGGGGDDSNLRCSNICRNSRRIPMVIKQKSNSPPSKSGWGSPQHTRKCHPCRHLAACQSLYELPSRHQFIRALHCVIGFLCALNVPSSLPSFC